MKNPGKIKKMTRKRRAIRVTSAILLLGILSALFSIGSPIAPQKAAAVVPMGEMYSCSNTKESNEAIKEATSLKFNDVVNLLEWINKRETYCVTVDIGDTGRYVAIGNVPNIQRLIVNNVIILFLDNGYAMSQRPETVERVQQGLPLDVAYQEGLPNAMYRGETPLVTLAIGDMLLEDNIFATIGQKIGSLFGGSITSPPSKKDIEGSLRYISPRDYSSKLNTVATIMKNGASAIRNLPEGQCLIQDEDCEYGGNYFFSHDMLDDLLDMSPADIRKNLAERTGPRFQDVQISIALLLKVKGTPIERSMPIDTSNLITQDATLFSGIEDPRLGLRPLGSITYHFSVMMMTINGWFADWTSTILGFISWDWIEDSGLFLLLDSSIAQLVLAIIASMFLIRLLVMIFKVVSGNASSKAWAGLIGAFIVFMIIASAAISPGWIQNTGKYTISLSNTLATQMTNEMIIESTGSIKDVCGQDPTTQCIYRLPLLDTWSNYQFAKGINNKDMDMSKNDNDTLDIPRVDDVEIPNWGYYAASMMDRNDTNVYRAVDHFVAPTINIEDGKISKTQPFTNKEDPGVIQDWGGLLAGLIANMLIFEVWLMSLIQLLVFIELAIILGLFVVMALKGWVDSDIPHPFKMFGWALTRNFVWPVATAFVMGTMLAASAQGTMVLLATQIVLFSVLFLARKPLMRSNMMPFAQSIGQTEFGRKASAKLRATGRGMMMRAKMRMAVRR